MEAGDSTTKVSNPLIGSKLGGQYTLTALLGSGGMGSVYRAHQEMMDRDVAIKILPLELAQDDTNVQRLAREAKALGRLNHPNIVTTFDFGFTDQQEPYLVLELVDGVSLQAELKTLGYIPYGSSAPLFVQLADAMQYAHSNGVVHRDLKPHNIMIIRKDGKLRGKILDFGIAQLESESQRLTRAGEIWGSPYYMSPEQCSGEDVDHRTDIYSLGVLMYLTLSGQLPHKGDSFTDTINKKLTQPAPFFAMLKLPESQEVPSDLEEIIIKCLRRKPSERYQSMAELKEALVAFCNSGNVPNAYGTGFMNKVSQHKMKAAQKISKPHIGTVAQTNDLSKLVLPLVAVLAVGLVGAFGIFAGMVLQSRTDNSPPKPVSAPPQDVLISVPTPVKPVTKPETDAPIKPEGEAKTNTERKTKTEAKTNTDAKTKTEVKAQTKTESEPKTKPETKPDTQPEIRAVNIEVKPEKPVSPLKKVVKAIKTAVKNHREKAQARAEARKKRREQPADSGDGGQQEFKPRYRPDDSNAF